jgi:hypothetical protein
MDQGPRYIDLKSALLVRVWRPTLREEGLALSLRALEQLTDLVARSEVGEDLGLPARVSIQPP